MRLKKMKRVDKPFVIPYLKQIDQSVVVHNV